MLGYPIYKYSGLQSTFALVFPDDKGECMEKLYGMIQIH